MYKKVIKRLTDIAFSLLALVLSSPVLVAAALVVRSSSPGPILFTQERVGKDGRRFRIYKFRTMYIDPNRVITQTRSGDPDVVPLGSFLRRWKIDELPQIFNVLKGDMSIIGPRPCLLSTYEEMPDWARRRFVMRPGITGLAQISGSIALTWEERWKHDVHYIDACTFALDVAIVLKTVWVILRGEDRFRSLR